MSGPRRLRTLTSLCFVALLSACAQTPQPLYLWEGFTRQQYEALLRENASPQSQIESMEAHAAKALGGNSALPPGFRAHLGMLYLGSGNTDKARELWLTEKHAFPESAPYMNQLLKRLDGDVRKTTDAPRKNPV